VNPSALKLRTNFAIKIAVTGVKHSIQVDRSDIFSFDLKGLLFQMAKLSE